MATGQVKSIPVPVSKSVPTEEAPAMKVTETEDVATAVGEPAAPEADPDKHVADEQAKEVPTEKSADETAVPVVAEPVSVKETHEEAVVVADEVPTEISGDETAVAVVTDLAAVLETHVEAVAEVVPTEKPAEETPVPLVVEPAAVEETQEEATVEPAAEAEPEAPAQADDSAATVEAVEEAVVPAEKTEE
ncbi:uncharacterized protein [Primulina huaijiensis]|uniref:uncharacterized protein n=1 Tax=Primulina huaijiensis TaxID=1492673 RepID=UPI003CC78FCA